MYSSYSKSTLLWIRALLLGFFDEHGSLANVVIKRLIFFIGEVSSGVGS